MSLNKLIGTERADVWKINVLVYKSLKTVEIFEHVEIFKFFRQFSVQ